MGPQRAFTSLVPSPVDSAIWSLSLLKCISQNWTHFFWNHVPPFLQIWKVRSKEVKQDFLKVPCTGTQSMSSAWAQSLGWRQPWSPPGPHLLSSTPPAASTPHLPPFCIWYWGAGRRVLWAPIRGGHGGSQKNSIYSHLICTSWGSGQPAGLVQDVKLWEMPDCYHCQIQFPPIASAPPPGPWCPSVYGNGKVLAGYFYTEPLLGRRNFPPEPCLSAPSSFSSSCFYCKISNNI